MVTGKRLFAHVVGCPVYVPVSSSESDTSCVMSFACSYSQAFEENVQGLLVSRWSLCVGLSQNHATISS